MSCLDRTSVSTDPSVPTSAPLKILAGNACWADVYTNRAGRPSKLYSQCPNIGPDIIACQRTYGKKIFLSLGGANPTNQYLGTDAAGRIFADFLWGAFGPVNSTWRGPRPFGNAVVDGFDFDIESNIPTPLPPGVPSDYRTRGYVTMVNYFKYTLYPRDRSKSYYLSAAPQCIVPDAHFANVMNNAWFDFMFIQFYNTPQCSARAGINRSVRRVGQFDISFDRWNNNAPSRNPNIKLFIGLPGAPAAAARGDYLTPAEAQSTIRRFYGRARFGGVMVWEATYDFRNTVCNRPFGGMMKDILRAVSRGTTVNTANCGGTIRRRTTEERPLEIAAA
jgi:chitinase